MKLPYTSSVLFGLALLIFRTQPLEEGPLLASACPADAKTTRNSGKLKLLNLPLGIKVYTSKNIQQHLNLAISSKNHSRNSDPGFSRIDQLSWG
jgi:hypothetical protein